ncbi:hypothetical protein FI667_g4765, partial [Globisporangium splendens]
MTSAHGMDTLAATNRSAPKPWLFFSFAFSPHHHSKKHPRESRDRGGCSSWRDLVACLREWFTALVSLPPPFRKWRLGIPRAFRQTANFNFRSLRATFHLICGTFV